MEPPGNLFLSSKFLVSFSLIVITIVNTVRDVILDAKLQSGAVL